MNNVYGILTGVTIYRQYLKHHLRNMSQCHIFLYESHMVCVGLKPGSPRLEAWALWLLYLPPVLSFNFGINLPHYTHNFNGQNLFTVVYVFLPGHQHARGELSCSGTKPGAAGAEPYTRPDKHFPEIAFHYTCGKLSGPGLSTKWLLKHNSLSVPFPVGTVSAMSLCQYAA